MTVDIAVLRALLAAASSHPSSHPWCVYPPGDRWGQGIGARDTKYTIGSFEDAADDQLAVGAVNALPELLDEVGGGRAAIKDARTALSSNGHCGDGNLAEMIVRAIAEAKQAGRDEMHEVACALMDADKAFDGELTRDWTGTLAERVRPLVTVYEAACAYVDTFRHTRDPLQGAALLFDAVDVARKTGP